MLFFGNLFLISLMRAHLVLKTQSTETNILMLFLQKNESSAFFFFFLTLYLLISQEINTYGNLFKMNSWTPKHLAELAAEYHKREWRWFLVALSSIKGYQHSLTENA